MTKRETSNMGGGKRVSSSFFKVMVLDFEQKLRIPQGFTKNLIGRLGEKLLLKTQAGESWRVDLESDHGVLFFGNGWGEFVKDNSLETGDFIRFLYDGGFLLDVIIFGRDECEKSGKTRKKRNNISPSNQKHQLQERREDHFQVIDSCCCMGILKAPVKPPAVPSPVAELKLKDNMVFESKFCPMKLKHPHFKRTVSPKTTLPAAFVRKYGLKRKKFELFEGDRGKKAWGLRLSYERSGRAKLLDGWLHFLGAHDVRIGETCVFELIGRKAFKVHFIQATTA